MASSVNRYKQYNNKRIILRRCAAGRANEQQRRAHERLSLVLALSVRHHRKPGIWPAGDLSSCVRSVIRVADDDTEWIPPVQQRLGIGPPVPFARLGRSDLWLRLSTHLSHETSLCRQAHKLTDRFTHSVSEDLGQPQAATPVATAGAIHCFHLPPAGRSLDSAAESSLRRVWSNVSDRFCRDRFCRLRPLNKRRDTSPRNV